MVYFFVERYLIFFYIRASSLGFSQPMLFVLCIDFLYSLYRLFFFSPATAFFSLSDIFPLSNKFDWVLVGFVRKLLNN